jgi:hypothetical protein
MATFVATTTSNGAALRDVEAARKLLDRYYWYGDVQAEIVGDDAEGQSYLSVYGHDWPGAWWIPDGVDKDAFVPDEDIDSGTGFEEFLAAIAPLLAEPLTIQAIGFENCRFPLSACEWHVKPGSTEVEVNGFRHSCFPETDNEVPTADFTVHVNC